MNNFIKKNVLLVFVFCLIFALFIPASASISQDIEDLSEEFIFISKSTADETVLLDKQNVLVETNTGKEIVLNVAESILGKISTLQAYELAEEYGDEDDIVQININNIVDVANEKDLSEIAMEDVEITSDQNNLLETTSGVMRSVPWVPYVSDENNTYYYDSEYSLPMFRFHTHFFHYSGSAHPHLPEYHSNNSPIPSLQDLSIS